MAGLCAWSALRSVLIALVACFPARALSGEFTARRPSFWRRACVLAPFLMPELLVGYAWGNTTLALVHQPWLLELIYMLLVVARVAPVGAVLLALAPPDPLSAEAQHCDRLLSDRSIRTVIANPRMMLQGPLRRLIPAVALMFLLAFQEFETASLMGVVHWNVALYDAHAGGLELSESLLRMVWPLIIQVVMLTPLLLLFKRRDAAPLPTTRSAREPLRASLFWTYSATAIVLVCLLPLLIDGGAWLEGIPAVLRSQSQRGNLVREAGASLAFGTVSAVLAVLLASVLSGRRQRFGWSLLMCLPGLLGSLVLGLCLLAVFQSSALIRLYDTPLPLVCALTLWLLPRALALSMVLFGRQSAESIHLARLQAASPGATQSASGRRLFWTTNGRRWIWMVSIIAWWGYWDLTSAAMLAPITLPTVSVRLYDLMHYGRNSVLSALALGALLLPLAAALLAFVVGRQIFARVAR